MSVNKYILHHTHKLLRRSFSAGALSTPCFSSVSNQRQCRPLKFILPFRRNSEGFKSLILSGCAVQWVSARRFASQSKPESKVRSTEISSGSLADQALAFKTATAEEEKQKEEEDKKSAENQVRALKFTGYAMIALFGSAGLYIFLVYGAPMKDQQGKDIEDEYSGYPFMIQYGKRAAAEIRNYVKYIVQPSRDKLLPDPVKPPYHQPYYTLLIELNGVLVHPEWMYKTGWRFKKRPGLDYFLTQVAGSGYQFEIVIYTHEPGMTAFPLIDALDQKNVVHYRLFRDSTKYENGIHKKDFDKLNRDLSKVIMVDCNEKAVDTHRNNALIIPRWNGNDDDRALFDLAALLQTIGNSEVKDVRGILEYYASFKDPVEEFKRKQMALVEQEKSALHDPKNSFTPGTSLLASLFRKH